MPSTMVLPTLFIPKTKYLINTSMIPLIYSVEEHVTVSNWACDVEHLRGFVHRPCCFEGVGVVVVVPVGSWIEDLLVDQVRLTERCAVLRQIVRYTKRR